MADDTRTPDARLRTFDILLAALESDLEPKGSEHPDYLQGKQAGLRLAIGRVREARFALSGDADTPEPGLPWEDCDASIEPYGWPCHLRRGHAGPHAPEAEPPDDHEHVWAGAEAYVYACQCGARKDAITGNVEAPHRSHTPTEQEDPDVNA